MRGGHYLPSIGDAPDAPRQAPAYPQQDRSVRPRANTRLDKAVGITLDDLKRAVEKVGNSIAAVSKEVDLQRAPEPLRPRMPVQIEPASHPAAETVVAEVQLTATGS